MLTQRNWRDLSAHHLYILRIDFSLLGVTRAELINRLKSKGIIPQVHYMPVPLHPYYRKLGFDEKSIPNAMKYYEEALSIPLFFELTEYEQELVINSITLE